MNMGHTLCALAAGIALSSVAIADPILEVEPNDTFGTAQFLGGSELFAENGAFSVLAFLGAVDVDFYTIDLVPDELYTVSVFDFTPGDPFDNDSILGIFSPDGVLILFDDDGGPGFLSSIAFTVPKAGRYAFTVSGFGDDGFIGEHGEEFDYLLVVASTVPAPGALALLAMAGLSAARRRRRR